MFDSARATYYPDDHDLWLKLDPESLRGLSARLPKLAVPWLLTLEPYVDENAGEVALTIRFEPSPAGSAWSVRVEGERCLVSGPAGFEPWSQQLDDAVFYNDDAELSTPGWHMHLEVPGRPPTPAAGSVWTVTIAVGE